jgi:hypothetical protein
VTADSGECVIRLVKDGAEYELSLPASTDSEPLAAGDTVTTASVSEEGVLSVSFASGIDLEARPEDDFEAWQILGPRGLVVAMLRGGYASWW